MRHALAFMLSRCTAVLLVLALLQPAPVSAMTTQQEHDWGHGVAMQIVAEQGTLNDPVLQAWVDRVGASLLPQTVRKDIPYTFTILDSQDVNAFSLPGGYIFVDAGLLNFVHSDDELAAVLGHEIGHVERRHVVTLNQQARALEIILDLAGILVPAVGRFSNLAGNLALYKRARVDELQADQYGLMLMSRAGYDPDAMPEFLRRLDAVSEHHRSLFGKYFATHPALLDRIAHLNGYAPLDSPSADLLLSEAIRDERSGDYFMADAKLKRAVGAGAHGPIVQEYGNKLAAILERAAMSHTDAPPSKESSALAQAAKTELDNYEKYLDALGYYVDPQSLEGIAGTSRLRKILDGQMRLGRYLDHSFDAVSAALDQATDISSAAARLEHQLASRFGNGGQRVTTAQRRQYALLQARLVQASSQSQQAVVAARGAMSLGWSSSADIRHFLDAFDAVSNYKGGDMTAKDYRGLHQPLHDALAAGRKVAMASDVASRLVNDAEINVLLDDIDLFEPGANSERQISYSRLLALRFGISSQDMSAAMDAGASNADVAALAAIAQQTGQPPQREVLDLRASGKSITDFADGQGINAQTLEIQLGLVWTAYSDGTL